MSNQEFAYWKAYYNQKAVLEKEAEKAASKKGGIAGQDKFKKFMGGHKAQVPTE